MASRHQVHCINKRNHSSAHERIAYIGGINPDRSRWKLAENEAILSIEQKKYEFFVSVNGRSVNVVVATHNGRKYLKTEADGYSPDNLLSLPECP
ncbi:DUF3892 domain-containing protein [Mucilaginibacter corticis]|uniref:DUF3892 domain-containing protein n=1 Tax=Mucilaginibacter corticis TaxID=2597670 RepID=A0A556M9K4_9SPHI|nr:DUF3892 domain-containing protein [Mucilaginibacter corticis]TSJ36551.1 DUF3892 domain-containing protein [Mucilaginibacter corticis]